MTNKFKNEVDLKYQVYNSLFLGLPFDITLSTGTYLPIFQSYCESGLSQHLSPLEIIEKFFSESANLILQKDRVARLFNIVQYVERQVVLFDAIESAAFDKMNDLNGTGTVYNLHKKAFYRNLTEDLKSKLKDFSVNLVLTAHPTQFYPRAVLAIITALENAIRCNDLSEINNLLIQLGRTPFLKDERPSPLDEAHSLIWYLENIFYDTINLINSQIQEFDQDSHLDNNSTVIQLGFWPGGDRDGNPNVTATTTRQVIIELKKALLRCYHKDILKLQKKFTFKDTEELLAKIEVRIYQGLYEPDNSYQTSADLLADLSEVRNSLINLHQNLFIEDINHLIIKVKTFGLHFATLDIRQDSRIHSAVVKNVLSNIDSDLYQEIYSSDLTEAERCKILSETALKLNGLELDNPIEQDVLLSLDNVRWAQTTNGNASCHRYIISNCKSALNVIELLKLAHWQTWQDQIAELDIVPLFESISDLEQAALIMEQLYNNKTYQKHLAGRGNKQYVMLGFSDGTKDGGYFAANWSIYKAKEQLTAISRAANICLVFFDGRGGPPARGGGNTNKFYSSLGKSIEQKEIQLTIQGQTISSNFGTINSAKFNIEQLITAGIENELFNLENNELTPVQKALMDEISDLSWQSYQELKNDPNFLDYLEQVGTLNYFGLTNISSRPTRRANEQKLNLNDLRAIPFVGTWTQIKQNVPGYYGLGSALQSIDQKQGIKNIILLYQQNLFFRTLIDNCMQVLMKTNFDLTRHFEYHPQFGKIWQKISAEFLLTKIYLLKISGTNELMENDPNIKASIAVREKMVLPLLIIQQAALQIITSEEEKYSAEEQNDYHKLVLRTMFGIINASRNSV